MGKDLLEKAHRAAAVIVTGFRGLLIITGLTGRVRSFLMRRHRAGIDVPFEKLLVGSPVRPFGLAVQKGPYRIDLRVKVVEGGKYYGFYGLRPLWRAELERPVMRQDHVLQEDGELPGKISEAGKLPVYELDPHRYVAYEPALVRIIESPLVGKLVDLADVVEHGP